MHKINAQIVDTDLGAVAFCPDSLALYKVTPFLTGLLHDKQMLTRDDFLAAALGADLDDRSAGAIWRELIETELVCPDKSDDRAAMSDMGETPCLSGLAFLLYGCNLRCRYCYSDSGRYQDKTPPLTLEIACRAIDLLHRHAQPGGTVELTFEGGEPLLQFEMIRNIARYAERVLLTAGRTIKYNINTNGTVYTPAIAAFLRTHPVRLAVSIDGDRASHDNQRPFADGSGSFDRIMETILAFTAEGVNVSGALMTVSPATVHFAPAAAALLDQGVKSILINFIRSSRPDLAFTFGDAEIIGKQFSDLLLRLGSRATMVENYTTTLRKLQRRRKQSFGCSGGRGKVSIAGNGAIYPCSSFASNPEFVLGTLDNGIEPGAQRRFLVNTVEHKQPCQQCWARNLCGGGCNHAAYLGTGSIHQPNPVHCAITRQSLRAILGAAARQPKR